MVLQIARLVAVVALLCVAAAIATPKGRLPLALRGLAKMLRSCEGEKVSSCEGEKVRSCEGEKVRSCEGEKVRRSHPLTPSPSHPSAAKRALAFALVVLAVLLALI